MSPKDRTASYQLGNTIFRVTYGNITGIDSEVIVSSDDSSLSMSGGVSRAIAEAGGGQIQTDARKHTPLKVGDVAATSAGTLPAKYIFHAVTLDYASMIYPSEDDIRVATKRCMELADCLRAKSIAFPALGTGIGHFSFQLAAEVMTRTIADHLLGKTQIEHVVLALFPRNEVNDEGDLNIFYERAAAQASAYSQSKRLSTLMSELKQIADSTGNHNLFKNIESLEAEVNNANITLSEKTTDIAYLDQLTHRSDLGDISRRVADISTSVRDTAMDSWRDSKMDEKILQTRLTGLQTRLNIQISNLNEYQIEEAKYGGVMVPLKLKSAIQELEQQVSQLESEVNEVRAELKTIHLESV